MIRTVFAIALLLAIPGQGRAQAVFKCVIKGQPPVFQNQPCPLSAHTASIRQYQPVHETAPAEQRSVTRTTQQRARAAAVHVIPIGSDRCQQTKDARDAWERTVGLSRSYEALAQWNDRVRKACM